MGVAFPAAQSEQALRLLGLPTEGYEVVPTDVENCLLLCPRSTGSTRQIDPMERAYVELCSLDLARDLRQAEADRRAAEEQIGRLGEQLAEWQRQLMATSEKMAHFQQYSQERERYFAGEFHRLLQHPDVSGAEVFDAGVRVFTGAIEIAYRQQRFRIGEFRIDLYIQGRVVITNLRNFGRNTSHHHPHVSGSSVCFGNIASAVHKLLGEFELVTAAFVIIEFLKSYNNSNPYCSIANWPEV